jgi:hypothetical protein
LQSSRERLSQISVSFQEPAWHGFQSLGDRAGIFILPKSTLNRIFNHRNATDSKSMPLLQSKSWEEFIGSCAADLLSGRFDHTTLASSPEKP